MLKNRGNTNTGCHTNAPLSGQILYRRLKSNIWQNINIETFHYRGMTSRTIAETPVFSIKQGDK
jgi:hypothetical protein